MNAVADLFDRNSEGLIDWKEFIAALRPDWVERKPATDADKIHDEVKRLVMLCTCRQKFRVFQVGEGKYRVRSFGVNQLFQLKLVDNLNMFSDLRFNVFYKMKMLFSWSRT